MIRKSGAGNQGCSKSASSQISTSSTQVLFKIPRTDLVHFTFPQTIQQVMADIIPHKQAQAKQLRAEHGDKVLGNVTVEQIFGQSLLCSRRIAPQGLNEAF